ncbi:MAG: sporulation protein YabP [Peptococcaceae bacterium]|nr:sporulation protein YabP [Peptococcaceae bacterium]
MDGAVKPKEHQLHLTNRQKLALSGITSVGAFDETEILLDSTMGKMILKGTELHITQLNLDNESLVVEGTIKAIIYTDENSKGIKGKRLLDKILR